MTALIEMVALKLSSLPAQVVRGWPQDLVPFPSCTLTVLEDKQQGDYGRAAAVGLTMRAIAPEAADALAEQADQLMRGLGWRRTGCRDGAEKDGSCFHKTMRYDLALPGEERVALTLSGIPYAAQVVRREWARPTLDHTALNDPAPRLAAGRGTQRSMRLRLNGAAAPALHTAMTNGERVQLEGTCWLVTAVTAQAGAAETTLHETL